MTITALLNWINGEITRQEKSPAYTDAEYYRQEGAASALEDVRDKIQRMIMDGDFV